MLVMGISHGYRLIMPKVVALSLIHISEPTRLRRISYAVFCLKKKTKKKKKQKKKTKKKKKKKKKNKKKTIFFNNTATTEIYT